MGQTNKTKGKKAPLRRRLSDGFRRMFGMQKKKTKPVKHLQRSTKTNNNRLMPVHTSTRTDTQPDTSDPKFGVKLVLGCDQTATFRSVRVKKSDSQQQKMNSSSCSTMSGNSVIVNSFKPKTKQNQTLQLSFSSDSISSTSIQSDSERRDEVVPKSHQMTSTTKYFNNCPEEVKPRSVSNSRPMFKINDANTHRTTVTIEELQSATKHIKRAISDAEHKPTEQERMVHVGTTEETQGQIKEPAKITYKGKVYLSQGSQTDPPTNAMIEEERKTRLLERRKRHMTRHVRKRSVVKRSNKESSTKTSQRKSKSGQIMVKVLPSVTELKQVKLRSVNKDALVGTVEKTSTPASKTAASQTDPITEATETEKPKENVDTASQTDLSFIGFNSGYHISHSAVWNQSYNNAQKGVFTSIYPTSKTMTNQQTTTTTAVPESTNIPVDQSYVKQLDENTFMVHFEPPNQDESKSENEFSWVLIRKVDNDAGVLCETGKDTNELMILCNEIIDQNKELETSCVCGKCSPMPLSWKGKWFECDGNEEKMKQAMMTPNFTNSFQQDQSMKVFFTSITNNNNTISTNAQQNNEPRTRLTSPIFNTLSPASSFVASGQVSTPASDFSSFTRNREGAGHSKRFQAPEEASSLTEVMIQLQNEIGNRQSILHKVTDAPQARHSVVFDTSRRVYEMSISQSHSVQSDEEMPTNERSTHTPDPISTGGRDLSAAGDGPDTRGLSLHDNDEDSLSIDLGIWGNINDTFDLLDPNGAMQPASISFSHSLDSLSIDDIPDDEFFLVKGNLATQKPKILVDPNRIIFQDPKSCDSSSVGNASPIIEDEWLTISSPSIGSTQSDSLESITAKRNCQDYERLMEDGSTEHLNRSIVDAESIPDSQIDQNAFEIEEYEQQHQTSYTTEESTMMSSSHNFESSLFSSQTFTTETTSMVTQMQSTVSSSSTNQIEYGIM